MAAIAGNKIIGSGRLGAFEEDVVVGVDAFDNSKPRLNPMSQLANRPERAFDNFRRPFELRAADYLVIRQKRHRKRKGVFDRKGHL